MNLNTHNSNPGVTTINVNRAQLRELQRDRSRAICRSRPVRVYDLDTRGSDAYRAR